MSKVGLFVLRFLQHPCPKGLLVREIARKTGITEKEALRVLISLKDQGYITMKDGVVRRTPAGANMARPRVAPLQF